MGDVDAISTLRLYVPVDNYDPEQYQQVPAVSIWRFHEAVTREST